MDKQCNNVQLNINSTNINKSYMTSTWFGHKPVQVDLPIINLDLSYIENHIFVFLLALIISLFGSSKSLLFKKNFIIIIQNIFAVFLYCDLLKHYTHDLIIKQTFFKNTIFVSSHM